MSQAGSIDVEKSNPQIPTSFTTDSGIAIPLANNLEILGDGIGTVTSASGKTIIVAMKDGLNPISSILTDSGGISVKTNGVGVLTISGSESIAVTGNGPGSTVTVTGKDATYLTKGVAKFNSTHFTVTNGSVDINPSFVGLTLTGDSGGAINPASGNFNIVGSTNIVTAGAGSTLTLALQGLTNHNVLLGSGTNTITNVAPSATAGNPLLSTGAGSDPAFGGGIVGSTLTLSGASLTPVSIASTDPSSAGGPTLDIYRNSASPANTDILGVLNFTGNSSLGTKRIYSSVQTQIVDVTDASEDAQIQRSVMVNGALSIVETLTGTGLNQTPIGATTADSGRFTTLTGTGTANINISGAATTTIGTGGTGIVNIGNSTGNTAVTGSLTASTTLTASSGDITATSGNIVASAGALNATSTGLTLSTLTSTDAGATAGPIVDIYRNSVSATFSDILGQIKFTGNSTTGVKRVYGSLETNIISPTNAAETSSQTRSVMVGGTNTIVETLTPTGLNSTAIGASSASTGAFTTLTSTGTASINASGAATTTIGTGGTGAVNIGNATGNTAVTGSLTASTTLTASSGDITASSGTFIASTSGLTLATLTSTDAGATAGPILDVFRDSASPAASDIIGQVLLTGRSSTGVKRSYASIQGNITSATNTAETSTQTRSVMVAGTLTVVETLTGTGLNSTAIGATTPSTGAFTTLSASTPLPTTSGGSGVGTFTSNGILYGNSTGNILVTAQGAANTVLLGNAGVPSFGAVPAAALPANLSAIAALTFAADKMIALTGASACSTDDFSQVLKTFTPTIQGGSVAGTITYVAQSGFYIKIGRMVFVYIYISWSGVGTGAGNIQVASLPFTVNATTNYFGSASVVPSVITYPVGATELVGLPITNTTYIATYGCGTTIGNTATSLAANTSGTMFVSAHYETAS